MREPVRIHPTVLCRPARIAALELFTGQRATPAGRIAVLRPPVHAPREDDLDFALSDYVGDPEPPKGAA